MMKNITEKNIRRGNRLPSLVVESQMKKTGCGTQCHGLVAKVGFGHTGFNGLRDLF